MINEKMAHQGFSLSIRNLINMTNGVVGLSILTMPFCFEQCGLVLATLTLLVCALMTSYSCSLLIESSNINKIRQFEFIAFRLFGNKGKIFLELCIILLMFGSLITNQQIINEVGPSFILNLFSISDFRIPVWVFLLVFTILVTLPINLSKKLDKLNKISAFGIFFYFVFGFYMIWLALERINNDDKWISQIKLWDFSGLLKCFPIFSISFCCQTVLFIVYDELCENSKLNIKKYADMAITTAFFAYFLAGFFGYIAFYEIHILGNALGNIPDTFMNQIIKFGFIICALSSYPFLVFPCRNSLHTLVISINSLLRNNQETNDSFDSEIVMSEWEFKCVTYFIVIVSALVSIIVPNIEFMLSLSGATTGSLICYVWPSLLYIYTQNTRSARDEIKDIVVNIFFAAGLMICFFCTLTTFIKYQPTLQSDLTDNQVAEGYKSLPSLVTIEKLLIGMKKKIDKSHFFQYTPLAEVDS